MPIYNCRVVDTRGRTSSFVREAASEEVLIRELNKEDIFPLEVRQAGEAPKQAARRRRFSRAAVIEFTETVSVLLASGLTFRDALEVAQTIFLKGEINRMVAHLLEQIRKGASVTDAVAGLGEGLPPLYRGFIRIGEKIGSLEEAFKQLAAYLGEDRKVRDKLASSLIYPIMVLGVAFVGIAGIVIFVLPRIQAMFQQLGAALPARLSSALGLFRGGVFGGGLLLAGALAAVLVLSALRRNNPALALALDRLVLRLPVYGRVRYLREILNLLFALEMLTAGGFSVEDALGESAEVTGNQAFRAALAKARESIVGGENLSAAFLGSPVFSSRIGRWVAVGERAGQVEQVFGQLRRYYQVEIEKWSSRFMNLVEPILILGVGLVIFLVIIFFIMPIFSIYEGIL
jgi:type II secretory pathway component PulF